MTKKYLKNPNYFNILDEDSCNVYYGCNQEWYTKKWQRMAGCGPTTAANIVIYKNKSIHESKSCAMNIMNEMWSYVTPTLKGVNTTKIFYEGFMAYAKSKGINASFEVLDISKKESTRPSFEKLIDFVERTLDRDIPLAFLNLCNGDEKFLDKWHWVTLISLDYDAEKGIASAEILDEGMIKTINLNLWYNTTTLGGGFVSLSFDDKK